MLDEETKVETAETAELNESTEAVLNDDAKSSGRDEEKTKLLQEALFRDTNANVLNSSVENFQEQLVSEMGNDLVSDKTER